ncbi:MAG: hypothetical protein OEO23_16750 [Gemmatimonadota bacterium]|nr:hypothetical protein [Gemmatimonadota bacterium]
MRARTSALVIAVIGAAAYGDSGTGPGLTEGFPNIDQAILSGFCIRGTAPPPAIRPGIIGTNDCPTEGTLVGTGDGYWEGWRVRVSDVTTVTFTVDSEFDSFLDLFQINVANPVLNSLIAFDDDGTGSLDAQLEWTLQPDTEYWILVSGFEALDLGSYTLDIT